MQIRFDIKRIPCFFGIGFAIDKKTQYDENDVYFWTVIHLKLTLGVWIWTTFFNYRKQKREYDEW